MAFRLNVRIGSPKHWPRMLVDFWKYKYSVWLIIDKLWIFSHYLHKKPKQVSNCVSV